jgi:uncharacterized membrane protein YdcZ (DUF606 family)
MAWIWWSGMRASVSVLQKVVDSTLVGATSRFFFGLFGPLAVFFSPWLDFMCLFSTPERKISLILPVFKKYWD